MPSQDILRQIYQIPTYMESYTPTRLDIKSSLINLIIFYFTQLQCFIPLSSFRQLRAYHLEQWQQQCNGSAMAMATIDGAGATWRQGKAQRWQLGAAAKYYEKHGLSILLNFRPHQFNVTCTKLKGLQHQPIDYVWALGLGTAYPWCWYHWAAPRGPWFEPITSHGWPVLQLSHLFNERTWFWCCLPTYIGADSVRQEKAQENDRYQFTHKT